MKNAKRILVAILAIALVAAVFTFSVSAEDEIKFRGEGIKEFDDILEYYEKANFLELDFSESDWDSCLKKDSDHSGSMKHYPKIVAEPAIDPANGENMLLNMEIPYNKGAGLVVENSGASAFLAEQMIVSFDIMFEESCLENMYYDLEVTLPSGVSAGMLRFDFRPYKELDAEGNEITVSEPTLQHAVWNSKTGTYDAAYEIVDGFTPAANVWYYVEFGFDAINDTCYIEITESGKDAFRVEIEILGATGIAAINARGQFDNTDVYRCSSEKVHNQNVQKFDSYTEADAKYACGAGKCRATIKAEYHVDNFKVYEGGFARNSDKNEITKTTLEDFGKMFNSGLLTSEDKLSLAVVLTKLYSFDSTVFPDDVAAVLPNAPAIANEIYVNETIARVNGMNKGEDYYARRDYLAFSLQYNGYLPQDDDQLLGTPGITEEMATALIASRKACAAESDELDIIKNHSEAFIQHISSYDPNVKDYFVLNEFCEHAESEIYSKRAPEYEGMDACLATYEEIVERVTTMNADVYVFVNHVTSMEYAVSFGFLFAAYEDATASYYKYGEPGVINPGLDNESNPEVSAKIAYYDMKTPFIKEKAQECDEFIAIINEAKNTSYYTSLVGKLKEAAPYIDKIQSDYPGMTEAIALYYGLSNSVEDAKNASEAYIAAVKAIEGKTEFYEKKKAVEAAVVLREHGDVLGYEGVTEANIALAEAEADINFREGNSTTLIALIAKIENAKTLSEKRTLIRFAITSAEGADDGYNGVTAAKAALADAVKAFEAAVSQANKMANEACKVAQTVASGVAGGNIFH